MEFVFSLWYIVAIALVVGIVACLVVFFKMDKKDAELINEFIKENQQSSEKEESSEINKN